jgi:hypothetical protein
MAYERTWQFMDVQGPFTPATNVKSVPYFNWVMKRMLLGQTNAGITQGLWSVYGSSDGSTAGMDAVDRWGSPFALPDMRTTVSGAPIGWIVLTTSIGGIPVWLSLLGAHTGGSTNESNLTVTLSSVAPTGGSTTVLPTITNPLRTVALLGTQPTFNADTTNARRYYGGLTSLGDFWIASTVSGEIEHWMTVVAPVGCKVNDAYPVYANGCTYSAAGNSVPAAGSRIFGLAADMAGKRYNGSTGYQFIAPTFQFAQLDASDVSLYDFPVWVMVADSTTPTALHARGRLPDMGIISGVLNPGSGAAARPCSVGTCVRDGLAAVKYVTLNGMVVPYNNLLS